MSDCLVVSNRPITHGQWFDSPEMLKRYLTIHPEIKQLFFVFWSWIVPSDILSKYTCYGFHTGPLLEKRGYGGSPISNLQKLGVKWATLCVFKMTSKIDGGPVRVAIPIPLDREEIEIRETVDYFIPSIVEYLQQDVTIVPKHFKRLK